jgi:hypothetical protein
MLLVQGWVQRVIDSSRERNGLSPTAGVLGQRSNGGESKDPSQIVDYMLSMWEINDGVNLIERVLFSLSPGRQRSS